ncbi:hypothetical protein FPOA_03853 [Fusarium poae]|uniref:Uncharacterized protein n=1 Tax=Fusarium poae TaxID=36050 RepID=A0A1B8ASH9_FUSPO|nr:hypothetical protein FPOA_03853 [Fusarium poae]
MPATENAATFIGPALPPRPNQQSDHRLKQQLHDLQQTLDAEVSKNKQNQDLLSQSNEKVDELNQKVDELNRTLSETEYDVEEYKALWKQNASDLNSHLVNDRGFKSLDDKFFIDEVTLLRRNIRDFAYQYYDNWPEAVKVNPVRDIADMLDLDWNHMLRDFSPSFVVRAYIWAFLGHYVFSRFVWAGNPPAMRDLFDSLKPSPDLSQAERNERNRQIDLWKARTSTLLQDPLSLHQNIKHKEVQERIFKELTNYLIILLPPNVKTKDVGKQVEAIWNDAISLDMAMNTQASGLYLYYARRKEKPMRFESAKMEEELEGDGSPSSDTVTCILAPSLRRAGEVDGTPLAEPACLLKMLVSCRAGYTRTRGQHKTGDKDHGPQGAIRTAAANIRNRFNITS